MKLKIADFVTFLNAISGITSIFFSLRGNYLLSSIFLVLAAVFDSFDGEIARAFGGANNFGRELDSLSDVVSFVVAPAVMGMTLFPAVHMLVLSLVFVVAGIFRLARFNITRIDYFEGVPTTANGILFPLLCVRPNEYSFGFAYLIMAVLMVSWIKIKKIHIITR